MTPLIDFEGVKAAALHNARALLVEWLPGGEFKNDEYVPLNPEAGWAAHKFKEKFGFWPPRSQPTPQRPSPGVLSWVRSRSIAWARAKERAAWSGTGSEEH
jgi:hypothetical protein